MIQTSTAHSSAHATCCRCVREHDWLRLPCEVPNEAKSKDDPCSTDTSHQVKRCLARRSPAALHVQMLARRRTTRLLITGLVGVSHCKHGGLLWKFEHPSDTAQLVSDEPRLGHEVCHAAHETPLLHMSSASPLCSLIFVMTSPPYSAGGLQPFVPKTEKSSLRYPHWCWEERILTR